MRVGEPRLVVLIPVFCNQAGLDRSLTSLRETDGCFEVVVVDDGSVVPIESLAELRPGVTVSLLRLDRNRGIAAALNHRAYRTRRGTPWRLESVARVLKQAAR